MKKIIMLFILIISLIIIVRSSFAFEPGDDQFPLRVKCGTPDLMRQGIFGAQKINAGRPPKQVSAVSSEGHFKVHWDSTGTNAPPVIDIDNNKIPDYVDSTLIYLEYAWDLLVNELGYPEPISDNGLGGGNEVDVYLTNFAYYGLTIPDNMALSTSAFIEIDNNFAEFGMFYTLGYEALKVTTAHEFFHVIHFRYYSYMSFNWWMEQTAVWIEDRSWNNVNDYIAYLRAFFDNPTLSLNNNTDGTYKYGAGIFPMYLAKRFGDDIIKAIWNQAGTKKSDDIGQFNNVIPDGLGKALNEFAVWNYFTKERANDTAFHHDGSLFKQTVKNDFTAQKVSADSSFTMNHLTSRYIEIIFAGEFSVNDSLKISIIPAANGNFATSVIFYNTPENYKIVKLDNLEQIIQMGEIWQKAIIVTTCANTTGTYKCNFELDVIKSNVDVEKAPLYAFNVRGAFPNPFNPQTSIVFTIPKDCDVSVKVYNSLGQNVATIFEGPMIAGEKRIFWKPEDLSGGLYLVNISTPFGNKTFKTMFLK